MQASDSERALVAVAPGIYRFDTRYQRPGHTCCYIIVEDGRAALVDCGVPANAPALLDALNDLGITPGAVDHLIVTHVHLDHAGAAGVLMAALPAARLAVHPSGGKHLVDPRKLEKGVRALYGDDFFDHEYAPLQAVDAERVDETPDDAVISLAGRELRMIHTPGHAWHHQSIFDPRTATLLAGDAFGVGYPEMVGDDGPFVIPVTPPPQFAPEAFAASLDRIMALQPARVAPTHFEAVEQPGRVADELRRLLDHSVQYCLQADSVEALEEDLHALLADELARRGRGDESDRMHDLYRVDIWLTAQGMWTWRRKQEARAAEQQGGTG